MNDFVPDPLEPTDEEILAALRDVGETARREAFAAGLPIVFLRNGRIVRQFPDGHEEFRDASARQDQPAGKP